MCLLFHIILPLSSVLSLLLFLQLFHSSIISIHLYPVSHLPLSLSSLLYLIILFHTLLILALNHFSHISLFLFSSISIIPNLFPSTLTHSPFYPFLFLLFQYISIFIYLLLILHYILLTASCPLLHPLLIPFLCHLFPHTFTHFPIHPLLFFSSLVFYHLISYMHLPFLALYFAIIHLTVFSNLLPLTFFL